MAQWVKDVALSLQLLGSLPWSGFSPWHGNVHMPQVKPKKGGGLKKETVPQNYRVLRVLLRGDND